MIDKPFINLLLKKYLFNNFPNNKNRNKVLVMPDKYKKFTPIQYLKPLIKVDIIKYNIDIYSKKTHPKLCNFPIDWVVGWINLNNKTYYPKNYNIQRLRDNNELMYSLKSIYKYASWINKIYIILGGNTEPPVWLVNTPRIILIKEEDLYSPIQRNSETKKIFYGKIPNLSNHFIAADDDFFLGNYIYPEEFFSASGKPILNSVHMWHDGLGHIPIGWNKITYNEAICKFPYSTYSFYTNMNCQRKNPWILIKNYLLNNNLALKGTRLGPDIWLKTKDCNYPIIKFNEILYQKPKHFCINDDWNKKNPIIYHHQMKLLLDFLREKYPDNYNFHK